MTVHLLETNPTAEYTYCGTFKVASVTTTVEINDVTCAACVEAHDKVTALQGDDLTDEQRVLARLPEVFSLWTVYREAVTAVDQAFALGEFANAMFHLEFAYKDST